MGTSSLTTFRELALALREADAQYRERVHDLLFSRVFEARQAFAPARAARHVDLTVAIAWALETPASTVDPLAAQLGRDHRRIGFPPEIYDIFAQCLMEFLQLIQQRSLRLSAPTGRPRWCAWNQLSPSTFFLASHSPLPQRICLESGVRSPQPIFRMKPHSCFSTSQTLATPRHY